MGEVYKVEEAAKILRCSERAFRTLLAENKIEYFRVGNRIRITGDSIRDYIKQNTIDIKGDSENERNEQ